MASYIVAYDLVNKKDEQDYQELWDELEKLESIRVQLSLWFVSTHLSAQDLHDQLKSHMHSDDRLLISEIIADGLAGSEVFHGANDWLEGHPPRNCNGSLRA
ncbi:hypothetical protein [Novosphingobium sp. KA1]|uniref:hypothetical protein n=1 Tax=Novosphingobium sp. (strain KA1) TaxID=164608 RepID=UPI001A906D3A|nr:hypothetical protein [Novosphingobium sp. KA1]QSR18990.1 CRISPR-associated endonuclease Cas2 [Novosphingobium sp. KA1]